VALRALWRLEMFQGALQPVDHARTGIAGGERTILHNAFGFAIQMRCGMQIIRR
jgi:hypothetical protein